MIIFLISLIGLFISSHFVVKYSSLIAFDLEIPQIIVGLFIISIATTLPELIFGISASNLRHKEMAIGDQIGTVIANSTLILGLVSVITPIQSEFIPFIISGLFMFVSGFLFITFIKTGRKLEKIEGISLIFIYMLFVIIELFIK